MSGTRQPENSKRAHFRPRRFKKTTKNSTRRHQERHKKSEMVAGEGKKARNFGHPPFRASPFRAPCLFFHAWFFTLLKKSCLWSGQETKTPIWAKVGLAKVGHPNLGQSLSIKVGQSRSNFFCQSRIGQSQSKRLAKVGQIFFCQSRIGQSRSNKDGQSRFGQWASADLSARGGNRQHLVREGTQHQ